MGSWRTSGSRRRRYTIDDVCLLVVDASLFLLLFAVPLWFGGRHDLGRLLYAATVATASIAWTTRCLIRRDTTVRPTMAYAVLLGAIGLVTLQLMPLGDSLLASISPGIERVIPAWAPKSSFPFRLGEWNTVSLTPGRTTVGLAVLLSHALLFWLVLHRLREHRDVRRLLMGIGLASVMMATLGLLQWLTSNGKLLWLYAHPQREIGAQVQGAFANKNHFAHFVILGLAPLLLLLPASVKLARKSRRKVTTKREPVIRGVVIAAATISVTAVALSLSRGGIIALAAAATTGGGILAAFGLITRKTGLGAMGVAVACLFAVSLGQFDQVVDRYDDLLSTSAQQLDADGGRRALWAANLAAFRANPWVGYGVGSHADVYHAFLSRPFAKEFTHAESGYLQTLTECGLAGACLLVTAIGLVGIWSLKALHYERDPKHVRMIAAALSGLVASLVHSMVDFAWFVPACMMLALMLAAVLLRLSQLATPETARAAPGDSTWQMPASVFVLIPIAGVLAVVSLWGPGLGSLAWDRYRGLASYERELQSKVALLDDNLRAQQRNHLLVVRDEMVDALEQTVAYDPGHVRAHRRLAGRLIQRFDDHQLQHGGRLTLAQVGDSALRSKFPTREATVAWIRRAFGEQCETLLRAEQHARAALSRAPIQGDGYIYLHHLRFLAPPTMRDADAMFQQALIARPHAGGVLFEAGRHAMSTNDLDRAETLLIRASQAPGVQRLQIAEMLTPGMPAETYVSLFTPDTGMLGAVFARYRANGNVDDLRAIAEYAERIAESSDDKAGNTRHGFWAWVIASRAYSDLGDASGCLACIEKAHQLAPTNYTARRELAQAHEALNHFDEAARHARWCLSRRPDDWHMKKTLERRDDERLSESPSRESLVR